MLVVVRAERNVEGPMWCGLAAWTGRKVFGGARAVMDDVHGARLWLPRGWALKRCGD